MNFQKIAVSLQYLNYYSLFNSTKMKNLFVLFAALFSNVAFGQLHSINADSSNYVCIYEQFLQSNDTLILSGIRPNELKIEIADYVSNVGILTEIVLVNEKAFGTETQTKLYKIAVAESIEKDNKIVSKLDAFRNKNVQIGGKTPQIERMVTVYAKKGTTIIYNN